MFEKSSSLPKPLQTYPTGESAFKPHSFVGKGVNLSEFHL